MRGTALALRLCSEQMGRMPLEQWSLEETSTARVRAGGGKRAEEIAATRDRVTCFVWGIGL